MNTTSSLRRNSEEILNSFGINRKFKSRTVYKILKCLYETEINTN
jgi:hypothetical protein